MLKRIEEEREEVETGVLCSGNIFRLSEVKRSSTNREGECNLTEESDYGSIP